MGRVVILLVAFWSYPTKTPHTDAYTDIKAHCVSWTRYDDRMTEAHENTHQINSEARNRLGDGRQAFYCLDDRLAVLSERPIKLSDVARAVPKAQRGKVYNLYMVQQQFPPPKPWPPGVIFEGHNDTPLYILDEMVAYTNGAIVGKAYKVNGWEHERNCAKELTAYAFVMCGVLRSRGLDDKDIREFITWNQARIP